MLTSTMSLCHKDLVTKFGQITDNNKVFPSRQGTKITNGDHIGTMAMGKGELEAGFSVAGSRQ